MDDLLGEFGGLDLLVREPLVLLGAVPDIDGSLRTQLHTAQAADAVGAEAGLAADKLSIVPGIYGGAGAAANAGIACLEVPNPFGVRGRNSFPCVIAKYAII